MIPAPSVDGDTSNRKWVKRCVTEDPERQHHEKQQPDILCVKLISPDWQVAHYGICMTHQSKEEDGKHHHHEGIKFKSCNKVAMEQVMKSTRGAAARTSVSG